MESEFFPGTTLGRMSPKEIKELIDEAADANGTKGLGIVDGLALLGFWSVRPGSDMRIGVRVGNEFVSTEALGSNRTPVHGNIDVVLERLYMADLPTSGTCTIQMNWSVSHFFSNGAKPVAHVVCADASPGAAARVRNIPLFSNLAAKGGIDLKLGLVAITDPRDNPIVTILESGLLKNGLRLAGHFNPVFAATVPYVNAITKGLTEKSRRNYKLAEWRCGLAADPRSTLPLVEGEYVLLDGKLRIEGEDEDVHWPKMTWNPEAERIEYAGRPFLNSHIVIRVQATQPEDAAGAANRD